MALPTYTYSSILTQNGTGIPGVLCVLENMYGQVLQKTVTQGDLNSPNTLQQTIHNLSLAQYPVQDGRFIFVNLSAGVYKVRLYGEGFTEESTLTITVGGSTQDDATVDTKAAQHTNYVNQVNTIV